MQKRADVESRERTRETKEASISWLALATTVRQPAATPRGGVAPERN